MRRSRLGRRASDDRGAVLILVALLLTALLVIVALVIDLGFVRQNRQVDKSAADFAAAAGIRSLDNGSGLVQPWKGICAARDYLLANNPSFAPLAHVDTAGNPISDPCTSPPATICTTADTWGTYIGLADGGKVRITIKNGYQLPDPAFPESGTAYAGDVGDNPCDNLAVIVEQREEPFFGGVAGASGYDTTIRSVARLVQDDEGVVTAALLILEREECGALMLEGNSGARIIVASSSGDPGVIHVDSLGRVCDGGKVIQVNGTPSNGPPVVAQRSSLPVGEELPGQISLVALTSASGAVPGNASSPVPTHVCVQLDADDCGTAAPFGEGALEPRNLVGRGVVDVRYRSHAIDLRDEADARFAWTTDQDALDAGFTPIDCGTTTSTFADQRIWLKGCPGGVFDGRGKTFAGSVDEVVIDGRIVVDGEGQTLRFDDIEKLYVKGVASATGPAIEFTGKNNNILINDGALTDADADGSVCDGRPTSARTKLVLNNGSIVAQGGSGKVLRMCGTTVFMMDRNGTCPIPTSDGWAPYENTCQGGIRVAGQNSLEWTAPNFTNGDPVPYFSEFEDLAFWSESHTPSFGEDAAMNIEGTGTVFLSGIFFSPNAEPFRVAGGGGYDIEDAQFITRKLTVAGNGTLVMKPQPNNAVRIPVLGGFTLVR